MGLLNLFPSAATPQRTETPTSAEISVSEQLAPDRGPGANLFADPPSPVSLPGWFMFI
ncbi:hypothetical protein SAMN06269173_1333 [Hymenobacter mucosus]|uniref:Uncharacterized protein n=1 Tax=Hymenobacter mucosus TaxID=1411120 RepID=A0A239BMC4_9BACT|nr:hypothetical protein SAMN06269173_1333 [Hymenobacter mucosus]